MIGEKRSCRAGTKTALRPGRRTGNTVDRPAGMATAHASEAFYALDDPLEAAALAVLVELGRGQRASQLLPEPGEPHGAGRTGANRIVRLEPRPVEALPNDFEATRGKGQRTLL